VSGNLDPRDLDSREREDGIHDREHEFLSLGRGGGGGLTKDSDEDTRDRDSDWRSERDREGPGQHNGRALDPRDAFVRDLDLPRGHDRELVRDRDREYSLKGSESRTLATVGAFRVVSERDLRDARGETLDLRHLQEQGLIQRVPLNEHERAVTLTQDGRELLEHHRAGHSDPRQTFYAGADRARERTHDSQLYRAYLKAAERLQTREARILRVELDRELKRDYQRFLQERNRGNRDSDGRPDRTAEEIQGWARDHGLPYYDGHVHFPDVRVEYQDVNGDVRWEDLEVTTEHYRGAHGAAAARSGFSIHGNGRTGGSTPFDPRTAEEFLR
jgi:DNA-binding MarR family transcriptional regulator